MTKKSDSTLVNSVIGGIVGAALMFVLITYTPVAAPADNTTNIQRENMSNQSAGQAAASAQAHEEAVVSAVQQSQPAVVSIVVTQDVPVIERYYEDVPGGLFSPFNDFFGGNGRGPFQFRVPRLRQNGTQEREIGGGSGFLISEDGMIVTNRHVVSQQDADYTVFLNDGSQHSADVVARDPVNDIAVIDIDGSDYPFLEFGDSDELNVGQTVIAIGNTLGEFRNTVSKGVVSGLSRQITAGNRTGQTEQLDEVIQTDAAINPGNSGGPLLNISGQVVGVNVAVAVGSENVGFALPANAVKDIVSDIQEKGRIVRPYLGVRFIPVTPALQEANNLSVDYGALVTRGQSPEQLAVTPGSPANKAGIVEGDIILEVDGERVTEDNTLAEIIRTKDVGDTIEVNVLSKGEEKTVTVTLEEFPPSAD